MKLWIRVDASAPVDPKMGQLADTLRVQRAHAFGLVAGVWCAMAAHAVDGDLSQVSDRSLEEWAGWTGQRGRFAVAFREAFLNQDSIMNGWSERQGKLLDRMERDRKRHQKTPDISPEPPRNDGGNSTESPGNLQGNSTSTERNGTVRTKNSSRAHARSGAKYPHFSDADCKRLYAAWQKLGSPTYSSFRKTFARLFPEQPPFSVEQLERAVTECITDAIATGRGEYISPSGFVDRAAYWVELSTPIAQRDAARSWQLGVAS